MEKDILNYLPTVMFRGTPCRFSSSTPLQVLLLNFDPIRFSSSTLTSSLGSWYLYSYPIRCSSYIPILDLESAESYHIIHRTAGYLSTSVLWAPRLGHARGPGAAAKSI